MKTIFSFFLLFSCLTMTVAQKNDCKKCQDVIKGLIIENKIEDIIKNFPRSIDSTAIDFFIKQYEIINIDHSEAEKILNKNYVEIIQFFYLDESRKYYCRPKYFKNFGPVLLIK